MNTSPPPLISIITSAYNIERYLPICLDSVLAQSFADFELLLIDDGSTDRTGSICDEYAKKDPRIRVIHQENGGVSDAWNRAIQFVRGQYTGFVDGDDFIHPRMYELLYRSITETRSDVAYCDYQKFYGEGCGDFSESQSGADDGSFIQVSTIEAEMAANIDFSSVWRGLYLTSLIRGISFLSKKNGQDNLWSACVLLNAKRIARVRKTLYQWRRRKGSESSIAVHSRMLDYVQVRRCTVEYLKAHGPEWVVPYTISQFNTCVEAENRKRRLKDPDRESLHEREISLARRLFSEISAGQILKDRYAGRKKKWLALLGKVSFPLACFAKRTFKAASKSLKRRLAGGR